MTQQVQIIKTWLPSPVAEFNAVQKPREYTDLIKCQSPKFPAFIRQYGRPALQDIFSLTVTQLSEGLGLPITGGQVDDAVDIIIDEYPDTKLSDLLLFKRQMLRGTLGGQVDDKLWKWNTRSICQAWADYYAKREDVFCEHREQKHNEAKQEYNSGIAKAFANATPEQQEKHREQLRRNEETKAKLSIGTQNDTIPQRATLEDLARLEGIDPELLAKEIRRRALARQHVEKEFQLPESVLLANEVASIQHYARKDSKYLHEIMNTK